MSLQSGDHPRPRTCALSKALGYDYSCLPVSMSGSADLEETRIALIAPGRATTTLGSTA